MFVLRPDLWRAVGHPKSLWRRLRLGPSLGPSLRGSDRDRAHRNLEIERKKLRDFRGDTATMVARRAQILLISNTKLEIGAELQHQLKLENLERACEFMTWCPTCYWTYQVRLLQIDKTFHWFDGFWCLILQLGVPVTVPQWQHSRPAQIYLPIPMGCIFWALIDLLGNAWAVPAQFLLTWHSHGSLLGESDGLPFSLPRERFGEPPLWIYCRVLGYRQCTSLKGSTERLPVDATVHSG